MVLWICRRKSRREIVCSLPEARASVRQWQWVQGDKTPKRCGVDIIGLGVWLMECRKGDRNGKGISPRLEQQRATMGELKETVR